MVVKYGFISGNESLDLSIISDFGMAFQVENGTILRKDLISGTL